MTTLKQFLTNTQDVTVHVPKTTGALSFFYITKGTETVRAGSMALVNFNLDTPVFVPTDKTDFSNCAKHVFDKTRRYALTAMLAYIKTLIAKTQDIGGRVCTTRR